MEQSLISILMPVKNSSRYLTDCLNSILNQTEENWELIAVNDHSTDSCESILADFSERDERIKYFNNTGSGIISALRLAYENSKGEFITRMDSDDLMSSDKLQCLKKALLDHGAGHLAVGLVKYFSETGLGEGYERYEQWLNGLNGVGNAFSEIYKECVIPSPCWMLHRNDLNLCAAFIPDRYPEDYDLCFRFYKAGLILIPSNKVLHHWRDYSNRTSRTDENYKDNRFLDIKLDYFLDLDRNLDSELILWGAGKKGKYLAKRMINMNCEFEWICNNENKIGREIYGKILQSEDRLNAGNKTAVQIIISVAQRAEQGKIEKDLIEQKLEKAKDYFFFC